MTAQAQIQICFTAYLKKMLFKDQNKILKTTEKKS